MPCRTRTALYYTCPSLQCESSTSSSRVKAFGCSAGWGHRRNRRSRTTVIPSRVKPSRCLRQRPPLFNTMLLTVISRTAFRVRYAVQTRAFATPSARSDFPEALDDGPSLDDFISGSSKRVVLGNVTAYVVVSAFYAFTGTIITANVFRPS